MSEKVITEKIRREKLAKLEHEQWVEWIKHQESMRKSMSVYLFKQKWKEWLFTATQTYDELTEFQKESDRKFADKVLIVCAEEEAKFEKDFNELADLKNSLIRRIVNLEKQEEEHNTKLQTALAECVIKRPEPTPYGTYREGYLDGIGFAVRKFEELLKDE